MTATAVPDDVSIRRATRSDLVDVRRIERDVFPQPWPPEAFERFVAEPGFLVADVELPGRNDARTATEGDVDRSLGGEHGVVGYVVADVISSYGTDIGHVKDLAVTAGSRGRGIGSALLSRALEVLSDEGARRAKLEVRESNDAARRLYDGFGFRLHRRLPSYYADGEDALVFVAALAEQDETDGR